jgi:hypothetical protein
VFSLTAGYCPQCANCRHLANFLEPRQSNPRGALVRTSVRQRPSGHCLDDPMFGLDLTDDETAKQDLGELGGLGADYET